MRQVDDDYDIDPGRTQVRSERFRVDGERARRHRIEDEPGGDPAVAVEPDRPEMVPGTKGRIDPLVAKDCDAGAGGLPIEHLRGAPEQGFLVKRRRGRGRLRAVPTEEERGDDEGADREPPGWAADSLPLPYQGEWPRSRHERGRDRQNRERGRHQRGG